jgi:hypothetical protein
VVCRGAAALPRNKDFNVVKLPRRRHGAELGGHKRATDARYPNAPRREIEADFPAAKIANGLSLAMLKGFLVQRNKSNRGL